MKRQMRSGPSQKPDTSTFLESAATSDQEGHRSTESCGLPENERLQDYVVYH